MESPVFDVSSAVAVLNQTLEFSYPTITIVGELSQFQVSKGKWLYFDIKDDSSKLKCFGSVWQLKTVLEDGMQVEVIAQPRLHNLYGFSLNIQSIRPVGEGSLKKAADLLHKKLEAEGIFSPERKRILPYPPEHIALVASGESAAYADFIKILHARWPFMDIDHYDVQVQGAQAEEDIVRAIQAVNQQATQPEVVILIRGGGSADDLAAFSTESVTRAVGLSRVPTLVAIGHEIDTSLAELAADVRASTPSNAAELLVPDKAAIEKSLLGSRVFLERVVREEVQRRLTLLEQTHAKLDEAVSSYIQTSRQSLAHAHLRLESYHPKQVLKRGYAIVRSGGKLLRDTTAIRTNDVLEVELEKVIINANVVSTKEKS